MRDTLQAIGAANDSFMQAFRAGDANAIAALYTADAKLLPPNSEMLWGTDAIRDFWQGAMDMGIKEAHLETVEVEESEALAVETGRYTLAIQPESGEGMTDKGKYVVVWKNEGGGWKLHIDIWNTSGPA